MSLLQSFKRALGFAPVVHPVDRGMARHWIKQRLLAVFPELRGNPKALEAAYRALSLEPRQNDEGGVTFEINVHREPDR